MKSAKTCCCALAVAFCVAAAALPSLAGQNLIDGAVNALRGSYGDRKGGMSMFLR